MHRKNENVRIRFEVPEAQALALAQLARRIGFNDVARCAVDKFEAYWMHYVMAALQRALAAE